MAYTTTMTPLVPLEGQGFQVSLVITPPDNVPGEEYTISPVVGPATGLILDTSTATVPPFAAGASSILTFRSTNGFPSAGAYTLEVFKTLDPMTVLATVAVTVAAAAAPPPPGGIPLAASITTPGAGGVLHGISNIVMAGTGGTAPYVHILRVNGVQVYTGAGNAFHWNTVPFANGTYELRLTVRDSTGARARVSVNVNVNNVAPPAVPPALPPPPVIPVPGPQVRNAGNWGLAILAFVIPTIIAFGALWWVWSEVKSGLHEFPKGADPAGVTVPAGSTGTTTNNGPVQSCTLGSTCINNQPPGPAAPPVPGGSGGKTAPPPPPPAGTSGATSTGGWHVWESPCRLTKASGSC